MLKQIKHSILRKIVRSKADPSLTGKCMQILGDRSKLGVWARIWLDHSLDIETIAHARLLEFIQDGSWTAKEIDIYKKGLGDGLMFPSECLMEHERLKAMQSQENIVQ